MYNNNINAKSLLNFTNTINKIKLFDNSKTRYVFDRKGDHSHTNVRAFENTYARKECICQDGKALETLADTP